MKSLKTLGGIGAIAVVTITAGCSSWNWDRTGQTNRNATVGSASGSSSTRDSTNSAGADTSGQIALGSQSGSTNPPPSSSSQSTSSGSQSYSTQPYVSGSSRIPIASMNSDSAASTSGANAGTNVASSGSSTSTPKMSENADNTLASPQQSASISTNGNMGAPNSAAPSATNQQSLIRSAQQALNQQGYDAGAVDGVMGPHTQNAIRKFQNAKGLQATGQLDAATVAALGVTQRYESSTTGMNAAPSRASASNASTTR